MGCFEKIKLDQFKIYQNDKATFINKDIFTVYEDCLEDNESVLFECSDCQSRDVESQIYFKKLPETFLLSINKENNFGEENLIKKYDSNINLEYQENSSEIFKEFDEKEKLPINIQSSIPYLYNTNWSRDFTE